MDDAELDLMIAEIRAKENLFDGGEVHRDAPMQRSHIEELEQERNIVLNLQFRRFLTISLGVADRAEAISSVAELIAAADRRLYRAKEYGRNCLVDT